MLGLGVSSRRDFLLVTAGNLCVQLVWALFLVLGVHIKAAGGNDAEVGGIVGTAGLSAMATTPVVALAVDRIGRRAIAVLGGACLLLGSLVFVMVSHPSSWLYVGRIGQGIGFAAYQNAALSIVADVLPPERRAQGFGLFGTAGTAALVIGPPLAEFVARRVGSYEAVFTLASGLSVAVALLGASVSACPQPGRAPSPRPWRLRHVLELHPTVLAATLQGAGFGILVTFVPIRARAAGLAFSMFFVAYTATLVSTRLAARALIDGARSPGSVPRLLLVWAAALAMLAPPVESWLLLLSGIASGFAHAVLYPVLSAAVIDVVHSEHRGRALGLFSLAFSLGGSLAVMACGVAADAWGYGTMFALAACTLALGARCVACSHGRSLAAGPGSIRPARIRRAPVARERPR